MNAQAPANRNRSAQRPACRRHLDNSPVAEDDRPVDDTVDDLEVVCCDEDDTPPCLQLEQTCDECRSRCIVEAGERFVEQQQAGIVQQRTLQRQALTHAAREALNGIVTTVVQPCALERRLDTSGNLWQLVQTPVERQILFGTQLGIEIEVMADETDALAQCRRRPRLVVTVTDAACGWGQEGGSNRNQRRLARTVGAQQRDNRRRCT